MFSKIWGSISSHKARAVLQGRVLCQQGCLGHSSMAWVNLQDMVG